MKDHQLFSMQGKLRVVSSLVVAKFHLIRIWRKNLNDSANLTSTEPTLR